MPFHPARLAALTAALAVLFETIGFLQGGFGNLLYFVLFSFTISLAISFGKSNHLLDPVGFSLLHQSKGMAENLTLAALRRMLPRNSGIVIQVGSALAYRGMIKAAKALVQLQYDDVTEEDPDEIIDEFRRRDAELLRYQSEFGALGGYAKMREQFDLKNG